MKEKPEGSPAQPRKPERLVQMSSGQSGILFGLVRQLVDHYQLRARIIERLKRWIGLRIWMGGTRGLQRLRE